MNEEGAAFFLGERKVLKRASTHEGKGIKNFLFWGFCRKEALKRGGASDHLHLSHRGHPPPSRRRILFRLFPSRLTGGRPPTTSFPTSIGWKPFGGSVSLTSSRRKRAICAFFLFGPRSAISAPTGIPLHLFTG